MKTWHGTVVDVAGQGVLLRGASGSGKSDLALRLIDRGASFVTDDRVILEKRRRGILATAPESIRGLLEVRGLGVVSVPVTGGTYLALVVDLVAAEQVLRMPEAETTEVEGQEIPLLRLNAFEVSTPVKIELAVRQTMKAEERAYE